MKVGILGSGAVAKTLAAGFLSHDHQVRLGTRQPAKLAEWMARNPTGLVGSVADAAAFGDMLVLAVKGAVASDVLRAAGASNLQAGSPVSVRYHDMNGTMHAGAVTANVGSGSTSTAAASTAPTT